MAVLPAQHPSTGSRVHTLAKRTSLDLQAYQTQPQGWCSRFYHISGYSRTETVRTDVISVHPTDPLKYGGASTLACQVKRELQAYFAVACSGSLECSTQVSILLYEWVTAP